VLEATQRLSASHVLGLATGFWVSQALYVAAKSGIADLLANGPKFVDTLAKTADLHPQSLHRVLRLLASFGVFTECEQGRFQNTPASEFLETGNPGSLRQFIIMVGESECWQSWGDLLYSAKTGKPAFDHVFGMPIFQYWSANPERGQIFDDAMASRSAAETSAILAVYDFSGANRIIDVGGGSGTLLMAILKRFPKLVGKLFDAPSVIERACNATYDDMTRGRLTLDAGDFFSAIPGGADVYILKHIIHDWEDDSAREILNRCRETMAPSSSLLVMETVIPEGNEPSFAKALDLHMLVWPGGRERTEGEYRNLFQSARLALRRVIPTRSAISIIEAYPA
jgi:O-methyltransferase domain/Dimerisation domain